MYRLQRIDCDARRYRTSHNKLTRSSLTSTSLPSNLFEKREVRWKRKCSQRSRILGSSRFETWPTYARPTVDWEPPADPSDSRPPPSPLDNHHYHHHHHYQRHPLATALYPFILLPLVLRQQNVSIPPLAAFFQGEGEYTWTYTHAYIHTDNVYSCEQTPCKRERATVLQIRNTPTLTERIAGKLGLLPPRRSSSIPSVSNHRRRRHRLSTLQPPPDEKPTSWSITSTRHNRQARDRDKCVLRKHPSLPLSGNLRTCGGARSHLSIANKRREANISLGNLQHLDAAKISHLFVGESLCQLNKHTGDYSRLLVASRYELASITCRSCFTTVISLSLSLLLSVFLSRDVQ